MAANMGTTVPSTYKLGTSQVSALYQGTTKVWPTTPQGGTATFTINLLSVPAYDIRAKIASNSIFSTAVLIGPWVTPVLGCNTLATFSLLTPYAYGSFYVMYERSDLNTVGSTTSMPNGTTTSACGAPICTIGTNATSCIRYISNTMFSSAGQWTQPCGLTNMNYWTYNNCTPSP